MIRSIQQKKTVYQDIYQRVKQIPAGRVATYGQIAAMLEKCSARMVGYAMANTPAKQDIPWQRVVNSQGRISIRSHGEADNRQKALLQAEGVHFDKSDKIDLSIYRWKQDPLQINAEINC